MELEAFAGMADSPMVQPSFKSLVPPPQPALSVLRIYLLAPSICQDCRNDSAYVSH